jgi:hypothetical protein
MVVCREILTSLPYASSTEQKSNGNDFLSTGEIVQLKPERDNVGSAVGFSQLRSVSSHTVTKVS